MNLSDIYEILSTADAAQKRQKLVVKPEVLEWFRKNVRPINEIGYIGSYAGIPVFVDEEQEESWKLVDYEDRY